MGAGARLPLFQRAIKALRTTRFRRGGGALGINSFPGSAEAGVQPRAARRIFSVPKTIDVSQVVRDLTANFRGVCLWNQVAAGGVTHPKPFAPCHPTGRVSAPCLKLKNAASTWGLPRPVN